MNSADDRSSAQRPRRKSGGLSIVLDIGYLLLASGCSFLLWAAFPGVHPAAVVLFFALSASALLPLRERLRRSALAPSASGAFSPDRPTPDPAGLSAADIAAGDSPNLLFSLSQFMHSTSDLGILSELVGTQTLRRIPASSLRIALAEPGASFLSYVYYSESGCRRSEREGVPFPGDEDLAGEVVRTGRTLAADYSQACRERGLPEREPYAAWAGAPLPSGSAVVGALVLLRDTPFSGAERSLLESIAMIAGPAIDRARLAGESTRVTERLAALPRASRRILGSADGKTLGDAILAGARELLPCRAAFLLLPDSSGGWSMDRHSGLPEAPADFPAIGMDHPLVRPAAGDHPVFLDRLPEEDAFGSAAGAAGLPFRSAVSLPLRRKEKILGWIFFWNPLRPLPPNPSDERMLGELSSVAVAALEADRPQPPPGSAAVNLVEELSSLQRLDQELNSASDPSGAMAITLDWAIRYSEAPAGLAVLAVDGSFEVAAADGYPDAARPDARARPPMDPAHFSKALQSGKAVLVRSQESVSPGLLPGGKSALFLPIRRNEQNLGVLLLESGSAGAFPPAEVEFLERLASHAAIAISNARLNAEVRSANQAKSEFISFVAHELKTPMTSIRGYTDLVAQGAVGPVSQPQANFLATIRLNVDRMSALVSDLNDVSRIESGRLKLEFSAVPLAPAVDEVLEALRSQIDAKEQKLTLEIPSDLPPVWVDRGRLIQVLTNLVSNANKYTPPHGALRIAAERSSNRWDPAGPPEVVHFLIQDSGLGISLQEQKSIFQKFFRSEDGTVRDIPGTGLGLHITRNLVEMHGGRIWFESEWQKGSTFHFTVPVASV